MIHHGSEGGIGPANFGTPEFNGFVEYVLAPHLGWLPGAPGSLDAWAALHDYVEFGGGILVALGLLTRPAALGLAATMALAVLFHLDADGLQGAPLGHVASYSYNFEEPLLYLCLFLGFAVNGSGPFALDGAVASALDDGNGD